MRTIESPVCIIAPIGHAVVVVALNLFEEKN